MLYLHNFKPIHTGYLHHISEHIFCSLRLPDGIGNDFFRTRDCLKRIGKEIYRIIGESLLYIIVLTFVGFPWWFSGKESTCQCRRCMFDPWVGKNPWRKKFQPTPVFLPGKSHGQRRLAGCSPWGHKSQTQLTN